MGYASSHMAQFSAVPIEPVEQEGFISGTLGLPSPRRGRLHSNLPSHSEPYWPAEVGLAGGSFVCGAILFCGSSAGYAAACMLIVGSLVIGAARLARDGSCCRPMLIAMTGVLVLLLFATSICAVTESIRFHVAVNDNIYKCSCEAKLSNDQCTEEAHTAGHTVGHFNCFHADGTMCLLCSSSGKTRLGVSCVFMWLGWLQQVVVVAYTFYILCCYVSPTHPFARNDPTVIVMGTAC